MRKYEPIDLLQLRAKATYKEWNDFLTKCYCNMDVDALLVMRYRLQTGMHELAKKKLNTEKLVLFFIRLQHSIERTIHRIIRIKHPNPCDDPLIANEYLNFQPEKRERDHNLEKIFKKTGY